MIELKNVCYRYKASLPEVLTGISYTFDSGVFYSISGKSGAGKSTFISLIAGLELPTSGDIFVDGKNLRETDLNKYRALSIGMVFQGNNLILRQSALDNVINALYLGETKPSDYKRRAAELLESVGITADKHKRTILKLSGGEQQRVAVARAIANNPKVIIADEPTGNLDPASADNVISLLRLAVSRDRRCVIMVTHDERIAAMADLRLELGGGQLAVQ